MILLDWEDSLSKTYDASTSESDELKEEEFEDILLMANLRLFPRIVSDLGGRRMHFLGTVIWKLVG